MFDFPSYSEYGHTIVLAFLWSSCILLILHPFYTQELPLEYNTWLLFRQAVDIILIKYVPPPSSWPYVFLFPSYHTYVLLTLSFSSPPSTSPSLPFVGQWVNRTQRLLVLLPVRVRVFPRADWAVDSGSCVEVCTVLIFTLWF